MTEAFLFDKKEILPCAALLEGEYGVYTGIEFINGTRPASAVRLPRRGAQ